MKWTEDLNARCWKQKGFCWEPWWYIDNSGNKVHHWMERPSLEYSKTPDKKRYEVRNIDTKEIVGGWGIDYNAWNY